MCSFQYDDDPEPEERIPAGPLYVPVRPGGAEVVVRRFRTPLGARTGVGFTGPDRLTATLGVPLLTVDPTFTAPAVAAVPPVAAPLPQASPVAARIA